MCWHKLGEVENEYTSEKPVLSANFVPKIFTIRPNLAKLWQKISLHSFFETRCTSASVNKKSGTATAHPSHRCPTSKTNFNIATNRDLLQDVLGRLIAHFRCTERHNDVSQQVCLQKPPVFSSRWFSRIFGCTCNAPSTLTQTDVKGRRLSWPEHTICQQLAQGCLQVTRLIYVLL